MAGRRATVSPAPTSKSRSTSPPPDPRIADELGTGDENPLAGQHRRLETVPGAQAEVDWGDEGALLGHAGIARKYRLASGSWTVLVQRADNANTVTATHDDWTFEVDVNV